MFTSLLLVIEPVFEWHEISVGGCVEELVEGLDLLDEVAVPVVIWSLNYLSQFESLLDQFVGGVDHILVAHGFGLFYKVFVKKSEGRGISHGINLVQESLAPFRVDQVSSRLLELGNFVVELGPVSVIDINFEIAIDVFALCFHIHVSPKVFASTGRISDLFEFWSKQVGSVPISLWVGLAPIHWHVVLNELFELQGLLGFQQLSEVRLGLVLKFSVDLVVMDGIINLAIVFHEFFFIQLANSHLQQTLEILFLHLDVLVKVHHIGHLVLD